MQAFQTEEILFTQTTGVCFFFLKCIYWMLSTVICLSLRANTNNMTLMQKESLFNNCYNF